MFIPRKIALDNGNTLEKGSRVNKNVCTSMFIILIMYGFFFTLIIALFNEFFF